MDYERMSQDDLDLEVHDPSYRKGTAIMSESLTLTVLPNGNLRLAASNEARARLRELQARGMDEVSILCELTEPYWTNGSYCPFDAGAGHPFVGLTDAPCVAESMDYPDDADGPEIVGRLWWFPNYMVTSPIDELKRKGRVVFALAQ